MTNENQLHELAKPLLEYLNKNHHPHTEIRITCNTVELIEVIENIPDDSFVGD